MNVNIRLHIFKKWNETNIDFQEFSLEVYYQICYSPVTRSNKDLFAGQIHINHAYS